MKRKGLGPALLAAALLLCPAGAAQARKPITREGLVNAVRINGLSTAELIQQIQSRGVSFRMTPDAEAEGLISLGGSMVVTGREGRAEDAFGGTETGLYISHVYSPQMELPFGGRSVFAAVRWRVTTIYSRRRGERHLRGCGRPHQRD